MSAQLSQSDNASNGAQDLKIWNCINCRRRKVRCDRRQPCAPCTRNNADCMFPVSGRIPHRSRNTNYPKPPAQKQAELLGGLRRLEAMVGNLTSQVENAAAVSHAIQPSYDSFNSTNATGETLNEKGEPNHQLVFPNQPRSGGSNDLPVETTIQNDVLDLPQVFDVSGDLAVANNGDIVVGDRFWTIFCKEVEHIFEAVHGSETTGHFDDGSSSTSGHRTHTGYYNFLLRSASLAHQREDLSPLPSQMLFLWQIYVENVDTFIKVLHVPTLTKVVREIRGSYQSLSISMKALVQVISLAAVMSLDDEEVQVNFDISKEQLIARYRLGAERALGQADFINSPDLVVLQALVIYLCVLQHTNESRSAWALAGVLVRVSVSLKLHDDGSLLTNVSQFETEMRRRLWWQICFIDSQSKDTQFCVSESNFDTKMPTNTDDEKLSAEMTSPPVTAEAWSDMTFSLIRCEIWKLSRRLQSITIDNHEKVKKFYRSKAEIEDIHLKDLDGNKPIQSFVQTTTQLFLAKIDLILHTQPHFAIFAGPHTSKSDKVFNLSVEIIMHTFNIQNESSWNAWRWQIQGRQPPWHALGVVLGQLSSRGWSPIYEQAWWWAKQSLDNIPEPVRGDHRYQWLSILASKIQRRATATKSDEVLDQFSRVPTVVHSNATSTTAVFLPARFSQDGIDGAVPLWAPQEPFATLRDDGIDALLNEDPSLVLDWQTWDEMDGNFGLALEFWNMNGL